MNASGQDPEQLIPSLNTPKYIAVIIAGLVLPAILIPTIKLTGYSEIVEEITKCIVIFFLILALPSYRKQLSLSAIFGFLFGLSESVFYLPIILQVSDGSLFFHRFLITIPMHILTVLVMTTSARPNRILILFGLIVAIGIHLAFNVLIGSSLFSF